MAFTISQTFFLVYLFVVLTCTAALLSNNEECLALYEFKQTISHQINDFGGFQKLDSWRKSKSNTSNSDCCLWAGVACNNKGHVTELDWGGISLTGVINSSSALFKLVHLRTLNLSMNNFFESQIPSEIARLKQLRILDLSNSQFNGQIPNEISQLIQLSSLDLSGNPLKLQSHGLEYLLKNMTRLEIIRLSSVNLSSPLPRFLANFSSLKYIELEGCQLQDEFPSAVFHLPKLKYVNMGNNSKLIGFLPEFHNETLLEHLDLFSTGFAGIIPESISNLNHLVFLSLESCHFSGYIPGSLPNLTQLTYMSLFDNDFTGLVPSLVSLSKLTTLALGKNGFKKESVYDWINKLTNLKALELQYMNMQGEVLPYIANLTKLNYFSARGNQLEGKIRSSFLNLKSLEHLYIDFNNFSGTVGLDSFLGLNKLERLYLGGNRLSVVTANNYTNETLPKLKHLHMSSCNLKEFPAFLRFRKEMEVLFLRNNEIKGLVPNWVWNNSQETLKIIDLAGNSITGFHQHPHFLPWIRLELFMMSYNQLQGLLPIPPQTINVYDVSNNNLTGEIPPWICEVKSLQLLDFSSNKMAGVLPPCLGNINNQLSFLVLKRNNFYGPMMNTCKQGSLLKEIDLSENHFTGQVSKSLANCTNLEFLSLADNSFEDVFPIWLGALSNLKVLILRSNKFYGTIQGLSSISSQFLKLQIIDISNNNFSGQLPDKSFQAWNAMKSVDLGGSYAMGSDYVYDLYVRSLFRYQMMLTNKGVKREYEKILSIFRAIDLSCNNFEGPMPQSLQDLHGLESLNLSHNHFTGHILPSLGTLKNLESLDLSQNKLSGQIPQKLTQLGFLAFLNVSFNHLNGRIPQGKQFNTFENNSYLGNPGLCGKPLSKECENSKASTIPPASGSNEYESLLPHDRIDWMVIILGVGSGLVIGIVIGNFVYASYGDWLLERFGMKDRWVRPLRNTRRN